MSMQNQERRLGPQEYLYWLMDHFSRTNFVVIATCEGTLTKGLVEEALSCLQAVRPPLRTRIVVEEQGVFFRACEQPAPIPLRWIEGDAADWCAHAEAEQIRRFETDVGPLMRCTCLSKGSLSTLLFTFHHAIADATSAMHLAYECFQSIATVSGGPNTQLTPYVAPVPLDVHIPRAFRGMGGLYKLWMQGNRQLLRFMRVGLPSMEVVDEVVFPDERRDRFVPMSLTREETKALVGTARAKGVTVHSLLCAAQMMSLHAQYPAQKAQGMGQLSLVNMRQQVHASLPPTMLGPLISFLTTFHSISELSDVWEVARDVRAQLLLQLRHHDPYLTLPFLARYVQKKSMHLIHKQSKARNLFRNIERLGPKVSLVSNAGRFLYGGELGPLKLHALHFLFALSSSGRFGSAVTTFDDTLFWNVTYAAPTFTRERAEQVGSHAKELLLSSL
tara:strand:+ start:1859 stop:3196 length:1338 start_codon:yes stop_codon:yes gene_type:complete